MATRILNLLFLLLLSTLLAGCIRYREEFHLESDLSGWVRLEILLPRAIVGSAGDSAPRLGEGDLQLPRGVRVRAHDARLEGELAHLEIELAFDHLALLTQVRMRFPGAQTPLRWGPWSKLAVREHNHIIDIERVPPADLPANLPELLDSDLGSLASRPTRITTAWCLARGPLQWITRERDSGWNSKSSAEDLELDRTVDLRTWLLDPHALSIRALRPLPLPSRLAFSLRAVAALVLAPRGVLLAIAIALALGWRELRRRRHAALERRE